MKRYIPESLLDEWNEEMSRELRIYPEGSFTREVFMSIFGL